MALSNKLNNNLAVISPTTSAASLSPLAQTLREFPVFRLLPAEDLQRVAGSALHRTFKPGAQIDTPAETVLVVIQGEVACYLFDAADKEYLLSHQGPGAFLGELSYLLPNLSEDEKIQIIAQHEVKAIQLQADRFFEVVTSTPLAAVAVMRILGDRLAAMNRFTKQAVDVQIDPSSVHAKNWREKWADRITARLGSFGFLGGLAFFSIAWILLNAGLYSTIGWDPYPFVFLNLVYSVLSGTTTSVLLISQNRQAQIDRIAARAHHHMTLRTADELHKLRQEIRHSPHYEVSGG